MYDKLLLDEYPLLVLPKLATAIGLNEAIVLQQIHYWLSKYRDHPDRKERERHFRDGRVWIYNSASDWQSNFPFWSERTIRRAISNLRKGYENANDGKDKKPTRNPLVLVGRYNKKGYDRTLWYSIDYEELSRVAQSMADDVDKMTTSPGPSDHVHEDKMVTPIPDTTPKTTPNIGADAPSAPPSETDPVPVTEPQPETPAALAVRSEIVPATEDDPEPERPLIKEIDDDTLEVPGAGNIPVRIPRRPTVGEIAQARARLPRCPGCDKTMGIIDLYDQSFYCVCGETFLFPREADEIAVKLAALASAQADLDAHLGARGGSPPSMPEGPTWKEKGAEPWADWGSEVKPQARQGVSWESIQKVGATLRDALALEPDWPDKKEVNTWVSGCAKLWRMAGGDLKPIAAAIERMNKKRLTISHPRSLVSELRAVVAEAESARDRAQEIVPA